MKSNNSCREEQRKLFKKRILATLKVWNKNIVSDLQIDDTVF